jgi:hypothetical protein
MRPTLRNVTDYLAYPCTNKQDRDIHRNFAKSRFGHSATLVSSLFISYASTLQLRIMSDAALGEMAVDFGCRDSSKPTHLFCQQLQIT